MSEVRHRLTILGCGSSGGVPRIGNDWGQCDPNNPKNRRRRCAALVERITPTGSTRVLIDTGPDVREQLLDANVEALDGVLFTHEHADHTHGIDDLRVLCYRMKRRIDIWADAETYDSLRLRFGYCFETPPGRNYPPIFEGHQIAPGEPIVIEGAGGPLTAVPIVQEHGNIASLAFRFGKLAYSSDVSSLVPEEAAKLSGLDVWIVDALRYIPHPAHFTVKQALGWIDRINPGRAILTHMHVDLDYETLRAELPDRVAPAFDGMVIEFDGTP
jgi:phosphoribosyl 1,2-cyclic phosphate phosphodiesterase